MFNASSIVKWGHEATLHRSQANYKSSLPCPRFIYFFYIFNTYFLLILK